MIKKRGRPRKHDPDIRNYQCRFYNECLTDAAKQNKQSLGCAGCQLEDDHSYEMTLSDFLGFLSLHLFLCDPDYHKKIFETTRSRRHFTDPIFYKSVLRQKEIFDIPPFQFAVPIWSGPLKIHGKRRTESNEV